MDKSSIAGLAGAVAPSRRAGAVSRRTWLGGALGAGSAAILAEVASLGGAWDHRRASSSFPPPLQSSAALPAGVPRLTHIGHSCHLIELSGQRWLTDPWFFNPAFGSLTHASARSVESIGPLDGIFISHRHADHFDPTALALLDKRARVWTSDPALLPAVGELGFARVQLSSPWQTEVIGAIAVSFAPAVHDVPQTSLVLSGPDASVLFCGDTGPHEHWEEIGRRYHPATALLPCDGTALRWEERQIMNPDEAASAAVRLGCQQIFQTHADASYTDPIARYALSYHESSPSSDFERALSVYRSRGSNPRIPAFASLRLGETRQLFS